MAKSSRKSKKRAKTPDYNDSSDDVHDAELDVEYLTTDPNSPFVNIDLIAEYSSPEFRALLTDEDKIEIAELLPDHVGLTGEGFFHDEFVRYDMDFRHGIRMYQTDLAEGRYDPEWLRQASQAMERRAAGDFDNWKEEQFEEFWGQKQRLDTNAKAGQSGTIKLNRLVEAGLFREGDIFSYMRVFGRGKSKLTVEKDVKIVDVDGTTLTCAIPPGQYKYPRRRMPEQGEETQAERVKYKDDEAASAITVNNSLKDGGPGGNKAEDEKASGDQTGSESPGRDEPVLAGNDQAGDADIACAGKTGESLQEENNAKQVPASVFTAKESTAEGKPTVKSAVDDATGDDYAKSIESPNKQGKMKDNSDVPTRSPSSLSQLSDVPPEVDDAVVVSVTTLQALEEKIVAVDGRLKKKIDGNAFKNIRVKRNNQDLGSLFEIREEWYTYKK